MKPSTTAEKRTMVFAELSNVITCTLTAVRSNDENALLDLLSEVDALKNAGSSFFLDTLDDLIAAALSGADDIVRDCIETLNLTEKE